MTGGRLPVGATVKVHAEGKVGEDGVLTIGCKRISLAELTDYATSYEVTEPRPVFKVGDRVEYVGDFTPHLKGKTGTIRTITNKTSYINIEVDWDDDVRAPGVLPESLSPTDKPKPVTYQAGDVHLYAGSPDYPRRRNARGEWIDQYGDIQASNDAEVERMGSSVRFIVLGGKPVSA
jgi:hypothetical protein